MTFRIEIDLEDADLERFRAMFEQAGRVAEAMPRDEILSATRDLVERAKGVNPAGFIRDRIDGLGKLVTMVDDPDWQLDEEDCARVIRALAYFVNPNDLIPDQTPGLGFLDDAIAAELVLRSLGHELEAYSDFCAYRSAELVRRQNRGQPTDISKEDWLKDRRLALQSRMRQLRAAGPEPGWTLRGIGI